MNALACQKAKATTRIFSGSDLVVGRRHFLLEHGECCCVSGCRRVTLWHPRPSPHIDIESTWRLKVIARVRWGDRCQGPEVEVDFKHGVILDIGGCKDYVDVEVVEALNVPAALQYELGALSVCCGAGAARGCATRTTESFTTEIEAVTVIPIPPFAYAVMFAPHADSSDFFVLNTIVTQAGSGPADVMMSLTGDIIPGEGWTLVGGAESIIVANGEAGADALSYEVVFLIGV